MIKSTKIGQVRNELYERQLIRQKIKLKELEVLAKKDAWLAAKKELDALKKTKPKVQDIARKCGVNVKYAYHISHNG